MRTYRQPKWFVCAAFLQCSTVLWVSDLYLWFYKPTLCSRGTLETNLGREMVMILLWIGVLCKTVELFSWDNMLDNLSAKPLSQSCFAFAWFETLAQQLWLMSLICEGNLQALWCYSWCQLVVLFSKYAIKYYQYYLAALLFQQGWHYESEIMNTWKRLSTSGKHFSSCFLFNMHPWWHGFILFFCLSRSCLFPFANLVKHEVRVQNSWGMALSLGWAAG